MKKVVMCSAILISCLAIMGMIAASYIQTEEEREQIVVCDEKTALSDSIPEEVQQVEGTSVADVQEKEISVAEDVEVTILDQVQPKNTTELYFNEYVIENVDDFINALLQFEHLQRVELCHSNLTNEEMDRLCQLFPDIKFVWVVKCGSFEVRTDQKAFSTMFVDYWHDSMTEADFQDLRYCTDLEALDLGHHIIKDVSFLKDLKKMKILIIAINEITDISPLENMHDLTYLELFLNRIEDLSPLKGLINLKYLNLCHNPYLGDLDPILHYPCLEKLWISHCNLTKAEIESVRAAYPNAKLEFNVYESVQAGWRSSDVYLPMRKAFNEQVIDEMFYPAFEVLDGEESTVIISDGTSAMNP